MPAVNRRTREPDAAAVAPLTPAAPVMVHAATKAARTRHVRFFPERLLYLIDRLTPPQIVAFLRLSSEFVQLDGALPANDKHLATVAKMTPKAWGELRDKLLVLGLGRIEFGHWIDDDQMRNLEMQRRASERAKTAAARSWAVRKVAGDEA
jgi:hypothetical protein